MPNLDPNEQVLKELLEVRHEESKKVNALVNSKGLRR